MKKIIQLLPVALLLVAGIVGCQSSNDPKAVLVHFFELLAKKDIDGAAKLATKDSKSTLDMIKKGMDMAQKMDTAAQKTDPAKEFRDVEFGDPRISGDTAYVKVSSKSKKQDPSEISLVKEDGQWKVDFSMAALMKMGMNKMQESGGAEGLEHPNVSPEQVEQAQKMADSVLKNMDPQKLKEIEGMVNSEQAQKMADSVLKHVDPKKVEEIRKSLEKTK
ncbi:DUF4878 domain-containing protein [Niabella sp. CC-SYL272]|uniref:DUF4878 domain-containing protein n=1 Tax=Niabella agricola TaxID=2891571 RepID=UPI001F297214|nr:DUF4878 domain-containing protein [Niabella agricola]MCF3109844.1 DUF4878 domain-containing protein [Niabella agricola]